MLWLSGARRRSPALGQGLWVSPHPSSLSSHLQSDQLLLLLLLPPFPLPLLGLSDCSELFSAIVEFGDPQRKAAMWVFPDRPA